MSINNEVDILSEMWLTTKEYIPSKDRQAAADHVISLVADLGVSESGLKQLGGTDSYLSHAVKEYLYEDEDEDEDVDYGSDDY